MDVYAEVAKRVGLSREEVKTRLLYVLYSNEIPSSVNTAEELVQYLVSYFLKLSR